MSNEITRLRPHQRLLILLSLFLLWPAAVNGGAFYFPDTTAYIRGVDAALNRAIGWRSIWTDSAVLPVKATTTDPQARTVESASRVVSRPILLGRSVYYGVLPFGGVVLGSQWFTILVQVLLGGVVIIGVVRHFVDPSQQAFSWTCSLAFGILAVGTLPFFLTILMPDFMAGIAILAAAMLIAGWKRETGVGRALWFVVIVAAALMHSANILILLTIALSALAWAGLTRGRGIARTAMVIAAAASLGLVGEFAFGAAVAKVTGVAPIRPPFITARLVEDGPGTAYLNQNCPASGFLLCKFRNRLPLPSDSFLWSPSPRDGVFSAVSFEERRSLAAEQGRFVSAVAISSPFDVVASAMQAAGRQFSMLGLMEFNYPPTGHLERMPAQVMVEIERTRAYARTMPVNAVELMLWPTLVLSLIILVGDLSFHQASKVSGYSSVVLIGWIANNIVCGVLSTPHERYNARVVWVLMLVALLVTARYLMARIHSRPPISGG
ncbi:hypothetical protein [Sphingomonas sp. M1-B02]|uniref:hypothetical protein n=1 Tax=Sphingomonas sp. M1-B02 TaxID=3114300 RepID=UPI00223EB885|nr:hypothetical protein [Sphingomonas sp. S6-11]UZK67746.1 hypothetical protein OKW87_07935 [Sphingomonas sp. S6-11]